MRKIYAIALSAMMGIATPGFMTQSARAADLFAMPPPPPPSPPPEEQGVDSTVLLVGGVVVVGGVICLVACENHQHVSP